MHPKTFSLLLDWMYGTIDMVLPLDKAVDVFVASDRLGMMSLHAECAQIIALSLTAKPNSELLEGTDVEEVAELWTFATAIQSEVVMKVSACVRALLSGVQAVWQHMCQSYMTSILDIV